MMIVTNLSVKTRFPIVTGFTYTFEKGTIYSIIAVNGSGKTTIFRALTGLIPISSGKVEILKQPLSKMKRSFFFYETSDWLDKHLNGLDYLRFVKIQWKSEILLTDVITKWQMSDFINLKISKYSLGMKQKLLIAMYIVSDADVLIFDEVNNGLDESSRKLLYSQLLSLKKAGKTIILSSHYLNDVKDITDHMFTLKDQKLYEE